MSTVGARILVLALLGAGCQRSPDAPSSGETDPVHVVAVDRRVSTYKDPLPPVTSPPPGIEAEAAERARRELFESGQFAIDGDTRKEALPHLRFRVPVEWTRQESAPPVVARYTLPGPGGDAELVVMGLEEGPKASVRQVERWRGRFISERGAPVGEGDAGVQNIVRGPLQITLVDVGGTLVAPEGPRLPHQRLFGAIVEGNDARYAMAAVGSAATMALWEQGFADFTVTFAVDPPP